MQDFQREHCLWPVKKDLKIRFKPNMTQMSQVSKTICQKNSSNFNGVVVFYFLSEPTNDRAQKAPESGNLHFRGETNLRKLMLSILAVTFTIN